MAYTVLNDVEYDKVWSAFEFSFGFIPNFDERKLPAIIEPRPSLVYSFASTPSEEDLSELSGFFEDLFCQAVGPSELMFALDWRHESYSFSPHRGYSDLPIGIYPDGDYYIFLGPKMAFGTFGHPWQNSLCVFGEPLVGAVSKQRPRILETLIRDNTQLRFQHLWTWATQLWRASGRY